MKKRIYGKILTRLVFAAMVISSGSHPQTLEERPNYPDEIIPLHAKPFRGKILKFEGETLYVEITKYKVVQIITLNLDSLKEVKKDFGAMKVSVWKSKPENTPRQVISQAPVLKLPPHRYLIAAKDTAAALAIERDSVFVGSVDRVDTSQRQRHLVDQMPVPLRKPTTEYPALAFSRRLQGHVTLRLWIDKEGIPQKWEVQECTDSVFVETSVASAMKWEFSPAVVKGAAVGVWAAITFEYEIQR